MSGELPCPPTRFFERAAAPSGARLAVSRLLGGMSRVTARGFLALAWLGAGCGALDGGDDPTVSAAFYGYAPALPDYTTTLTISVGGWNVSYAGARSASEGRPQQFESRALPGGALLRAVAVLRANDGRELARARTTLALESGWDYGIGFQAGGQNPDARGFCHHPPVVIPISGTGADSLYLWTAGLPRGAIC